MFYQIIISVCRLRHSFSFFFDSRKHLVLYFDTLITLAFDLQSRYDRPPLPHLNSGNVFHIRQ